jgi:hypothetical protein
MRKEAFLTARALPSRTRDLSLSRWNGRSAGRLAPPTPFQPLSRRSGRFPALPYPPDQVIAILNPTIGVGGEFTLFY